ncbi:MAG: lactonase family protein [Verrucomicrobiota bacterium]
MNTLLRSFLALVLVSVHSLWSTQALAASKEMLVYFGTYTGAKSKGIYFSRLDLNSGQLSAPDLAAEIVSPSFVAIHPNGRFLYTANEVAQWNGQPGGIVSAFAIDRASGKLTLLNQQSSRGGGPCHLVVDKSGRAVLVANYGGGNVAALPIEKDGRLREASAFIQHTGSSVNPQRQKEPHAHSINVDPGNRFAVAADLGLDKLLVYRFDSAKGSLMANDPAFASVAPGSGPRHFAFHPKGRRAFVINEMLCTITAFDFDPRRGALTELQTISTLPPEEKVQRGYSTAEIQVHPSGRFVYGSNRGHDSIVVCAIDQKTGQLTRVENEPTQGKTPRNFGIDPTGKFLLAANQNSDTVVVFRIDKNTGALESTGQSIPAPTPVCVKFLRL